MSVGLPSLAIFLLALTGGFDSVESGIWKPTYCTKSITNPSFSTSSETRVIQSAQVALFKNYCLSLKLSYDTITVPDYVPGHNITTLVGIQSHLNRWQPLERLPHCWPYLQRTLCSILMPKYEEEIGPNKITSLITRPNFEICMDLMKNCKFIETHYGWEPMFSCNDTNLYFRNCSNDLRDTKMESFLAQETSCLDPLVPSDNPKSWFEDVQGCALSCKFPISDTNDQTKLSLFIKNFSISGFIITLLAAILLAASYATERSSRIAEAIERFNLRQSIFYLGWSLQIFSSNDVGCGTNNLPLHGLPLVANMCVLSFFLTYLPSISNQFWYAYLSKLCYERLTNGERQPLSDVKLSSALDRCSYYIPALLFVIISLFGEIDGHGLYGVCTVGQQSITKKFIFILLPKILGNLFGGFYFFMTIINLSKMSLKKQSLKRTFFRIFLLATLNMTNIVFSVGNFVYDYYGHDKWKKSILNYIVCSLRPESPSQDSLATSSCIIEDKPIVAIFYLEVLSNLLPGIVIASWAFCDTNFKSLRQKVIYLLESEKDRKRRNCKCYKVVKSVDQMSYVSSVDSDHDVIDMTSPTRCRPDVELNCQDRATPSDLQSCNLPSWGSQTSTYAKQHKSSKKKLRSNEPRARDVIEDERKRRLLHETMQVTGMAAPPTDNARELMPLLQLLTNGALPLAGMNPGMLPFPSFLPNPIPDPGNFQSAATSHLHGLADHSLEEINGRRSAAFGKFYHGIAGGGDGGRIEPSTAEQRNEPS